MRRGLGTTRRSRVASDATTWRALGLALGSCWERGARGGAVANRTNALLTHRVCWTISEHINSSKQCGSREASGKSKGVGGFKIGYPKAIPYKRA